MPVRIVMPRLGDFMTEGMIAKLFKSPGEQVDRGQVIAEIETEKLNYDLEATDSGIFHPIVSEGDLVPVDELIGYLLAGDEQIPDENQGLASDINEDGLINITDVILLGNMILQN